MVVDVSGVFDNGVGGLSGGRRNVGSKFLVMIFFFGGACDQLLTRFVV